MFKNVLAILKSILLFLYCITLLFPLLLINLFFGVDRNRGLIVRKIFCQGAIHIMGVRLKVLNPPSKIEKAVMYISNHRSYFDPVITSSQIKAIPVAKAEVDQWPFIGFAAKSTGVVFVKRDSSGSRKNALIAMEKTLNEGDSVLIYPEGTTTRESTTLAFKKGAFRLAARLGVAVVPIMVDYKNPDAIWDGPEPFLGHFLKMFSSRINYSKTSFGPPIKNSDAEQLLDATQAWINSEIKKAQSSY